LVSFFVLQLNQHTANWRGVVEIWKKNLQDFPYTILVSRLGIKFFGDTGLVRSAEIVLILLPATLRQRSASFFSSTPKIGVSLCVFATV
jgi:hypothetical protein